MKFTVDCEVLRGIKDNTKITPHVRFDFRYDGHYAQFTVTAPGAVTALERLSDACSDLIDFESSFCVDGSLIYGYGDDGQFRLDSD